MRKYIGCVIAVLISNYAFAQQVKTNKLEFGEGGTYPDPATVFISIESNDLIFKDVANTTVTLTELLSTGTAIHGDLQGLTADDHTQYNTDTRHTDEHTSTGLNDASAITADTGGNGTLGTHMSDSIIHSPSNLNTLPDVTIQGTATFVTDNGDARGANAVDMQSTRINSTEVASGANSVISGGKNNTANAEDSFVGGGDGNTATGIESVIVGGNGNTVSDVLSFVGGGNGNTASGNTAIVVGGNANTASGVRGSIVGGRSNTADGNDSFIGSGFNNSASSLNSVIGGGENNVSSGLESTVGGGNSNSAIGDQSIVSGGGLNVASGLSSTIPGGLSNTASGDYSFAAGRRSKSTVQGSFTLSDSENSDTTNTVQDSIRMRFAGGYDFNGGAVDIEDDLTVGKVITGDGSGITSLPATIILSAQSGITSGGTRQAVILRGSTNSFEWESSATSQTMSWSWPAENDYTAGTAIDVTVYYYSETGSDNDVSWIFGTDSFGEGDPVISSVALTDTGANLSTPNATANDLTVSSTFTFTPAWVPEEKGSFVLIRGNDSAAGAINFLELSIRYLKNQ